MNDKNLFGEPVENMGAPPFIERWSNSKAFWIGVHAGRGLSVPAICDVMNDGLTPNMVTAMFDYWGFKASEGRQTHRPVKVMLSGKHRTLIHREAKARDTDMAELCRRILVQVAQDRMYRAILDI